MAVLPSLSIDDWHRLNRLLEAALALGSAERAAWLNTLGDDDRHLRAMLDDLLTQSESTAFANAEPPTTVAQLAAAALSAMRQEQPW